MDICICITILRQANGDPGKTRYWYRYNRLELGDEERVHVGEFLRLLRELAPDEEKYYAEGSVEVEKFIKKMRKNVSGKQV